jgi:hypothetical protein
VRFRSVGILFLFVFAVCSATTQSAGKLEWHPDLQPHFQDYEMEWVATQNTYVTEKNDLPKECKGIRQRFGQRLIQLLKSSSQAFVNPPDPRITEVLDFLELSITNGSLVVGIEFDLSGLGRYVVSGLYGTDAILLNTRSKSFYAGSNPIINPDENLKTLLFTFFHEGVHAQQDHELVLFSRAQGIELTKDQRSFEIYEREYEAQYLNNLLYGMSRDDAARRARMEMLINYSYLANKHFASNVQLLEYFLSGKCAGELRLGSQSIQTSNTSRHCEPTR